MNTNGNVYTLVYSTIIVVLVAAILACTAMVLKPKQQANIKAETISQMLTAAQFGTKADFGKLSNDQILSKYKEVIKEAFVINANGEKIADLDTKNIDLGSSLKAQNDNMKKGADLQLPVYIFNQNGKSVTVVPVYGAGLWGPIWGYFAFDEDKTTILGAYFDHDSETPGLGAKIKDDPAFQAQFIGKKADFAAEAIFTIAKNAGKSGKENAVDAITGSTMTSKGLDAAVNTWFAAYKNYFEK